MQMFKNQRELLAYHSNNYRDNFNPQLFNRSTEEIVEAVKKVILSICSEGTYFSIRVLKFETIEDYSTIKMILHDYGEDNKSRNKNKSGDNMYDFIDIKPSTFILLMVTYELTAKEDRLVIDVPIAIPKFINKYYINIQGNLYLPQIQIVDASTYNNGLTNAKSQTVVLKTLSPPIRLYKRTTQLITIDKQLVQTTFFDINAFKKTSRSFIYILAEYGLEGALRFLGIEGINVYDETHKPYPDPEFYVFHNKDNITMKYASAKIDLYVQVPKFLFDNDVVTQNMVIAIMDASIWLDSFSSIFGLDFWRRALGADFKSDTVEKGLGILTSFKGILDNITKEILHLPPELKENMFCILKWMVCEFSALRSKDNLNVMIKRIRIAEYIAAMYASKLNYAVYRIPDMGQRVTVDSLKKIVATDPMYLIKQLPSSQLISFNDIVTDCDATEATKFSVKGQSGLGDNNKKSGQGARYGAKKQAGADNSSKSIPMIYRYPHESHFGILDLDAVSASDPGVTGIICPMAKLYNGSFSEFEEPNTWPEMYAKLLDEYHRTTGRKEAIILRSKITGQIDKEALGITEQVLDITANSIAIVEQMLKQNSIDGRICPIISLNEDGKIDLALITRGG